MGSYQAAASDRPSGMRAFLIVWFGQVVSLFGTSMTQFALTIWAWEITGKATALALVGLFSFGPTVILSPLAGALVDRWNRKLVMMLSDLAAGLTTVVLFALYAADSLEIWHLYVAGAFSGAFQAFQWPAYSAAITLMIPKQHYARAEGLMETAQAASGIFAPVLAALLLAAIDLDGIMLIDIVTFVFAISALLYVRIPEPETTPEGRAGQGSLWQESLYGFKYIRARPSLLGLQIMFFMANLFGTMGFILLAPMILARTGNDELILGSAQSAAAVGGLVGGIAISVWGGPKRRVHGVLLGMFFSSLLGQMVLGLGRNVAVWIVAGFVVSFFMPVLNSSNQAIWQSKVPPDVQGRVFSVRRLIAQITAPFAMLVAGPLADEIFEPALMPDGALAGALGWLVGTGPGAGMAFIVALTGLLGAVAALSGYLFPFIRNAEDLIPDHEARIKETPLEADGAVEGAAPVLPT